MTLNEAIEYYDSLAEESRRKASIERNDYMDLRDESAEYRQLSQWLAELAVLREKVNCSELPNSSDCISRQAAIDVLHGYFDGMLETDTWSPRDVYGLIETLPPVQVEQKKKRWTAINKDDPATFPKEFDWVWVTGKNNHVEIAILSDGGYWLDTDEDYMADRDWVKAWMPFEFPEPYRGDAE